MVGINIRMGVERKCEIKHTLRVKRMRGPSLSTWLCSCG